MAKCTIAHGATSVIRHVRGLDSVATDGSGKTGVAFGSFTAKYVKPGGTLTDLATEDIATLGTYAAPTSNAHIRIKELADADPTKGVYEVQLHDDWLASGEMLTLFLSAAGMADLALEIQLGPVPSDVTHIGGNAAAVVMPAAAAAAGTLSTTQMTTTLTEATDDHYNGRVIIWTSGVLSAQATNITDYDGATKMLTYTAVTEAPAADDEFVIV